MDPTKYYIICSKQFDPKFIDQGKNTSYWKVNPILTVHTAKALQQPSNLQITT